MEKIVEDKVPIQKLKIILGGKSVGVKIVLVLLLLFLKLVLKQNKNNNVSGINMGNKLRFSHTCLKLNCLNNRIKITHKHIDKIHMD